MSANAPAPLYDEASSWYDTLFETGRMKLLRELNFKVIDEFIQNRPAMNVLDGGGGAGDYALYMAAAGHRVISVDISEGLVNVSRRKLAALKNPVSIEFQVNDLERMHGFRDETFDFILVEGGTLSYLSNPALGVKQVHRLLRPGGRAIVTAQNKYHFLGLAESVEVASFIRRRSRVPGAFNDVPMVTRCFSPEDFRTLLQQEGLKVERLGSKLLSTEILSFAERDLKDNASAGAAMAQSLEFEMLWDASFAGLGRSLMALCTKDP